MDENTTGKENQKTKTKINSTCNSNAWVERWIILLMRLQWLWWCQEWINKWIKKKIFWWRLDWEEQRGLDLTRPLGVRGKTDRPAAVSRDQLGHTRTHTHTELSVKTLISFILFPPPHSPATDGKRKCCVTLPHSASWNLFFFFIYTPATSI